MPILERDCFLNASRRIAAQGIPRPMPIAQYPAFANVTVHVMLMALEAVGVAVDQARVVVCTQ